MEKVICKSLNSANVRMDNSVDTGRVYDISANVNVENTNVSGMDGDVRRKDGTADAVATFNSWNGALSVSYQDLAMEEQQAVNAAVNAFIEDVKAKAQDGNITSMLNQ